MTRRGRPRPESDSPAAQVMVIHAALAAQRAAAFAAGLPHVLAGDFNVQPGATPQASPSMQNRHVTVDSLLL